jgi:hypothetical protein
VTFSVEAAIRLDATPTSQANSRKLGLNFFQLSIALIRLSKSKAASMFAA